MQPDFSRDARIAPIFTRIAQLPKKPRLLVTIDGPCGSGKSTLADALSDALNAPIIRMDDFFLPHALKTPQRLAIPGGNVDLERLMQEVITPLRRGSARRLSALPAPRGRILRADSPARRAHHDSGRQLQYAAGHPPSCGFDALPAD